MIFRFFLLQYQSISINTYAAWYRLTMGNENTSNHFYSFFFCKLLSILSVRLFQYFLLAFLQFCFIFILCLASKSLNSSEKLILHHFESNKFLNFLQIIICLTLWISWYHFIVECTWRSFSDRKVRFMVTKFINFIWKKFEKWKPTKKWSLLRFIYIV